MPLAWLNFKTKSRAPDVLGTRLFTGHYMLTLDHLLILSERYLHRVMKEYQGYFNRARPHQGIGQRIPCQPVVGAESKVIGELISRPVLGGLHRDYYWRSRERPPYPRVA